MARGNKKERNCVENSISLFFIKIYLFFWLLCRRRHWLIISIDLRGGWRKHSSQSLKMDPASLAFPPLIYCLWGQIKEKKWREMERNKRSDIITSFQEGPKIWRRIVSNRRHNPKESARADSSFEGELQPNKRLPFLNEERTNWAPWMRSCNPCGIRHSIDPSICTAAAETLHRHTFQTN